MKVPTLLLLMSLASLLGFASAAMAVNFHVELHAGSMFFHHDAFHSTAAQRLNHSRDAA